MVTEDDVDLDALQAQIDISMSFAHSLVTSWITPARFTQSGSSGVNATQLLEEELRRPPRLGVGASIPTASPLTHEASKLKRRLEKNGVKNEGTGKSQDPRSDDEECKGRPVKRKTKVDPFGQQGSKKKRRADLQHNLASSIENASKRSVSLKCNLNTRESTKHKPLSRKEKEWVGPGDQWAHVGEAQRSTTSSPSARTSIQTTFSPSLTATIAPLSEPSREISVPVPGDISTLESNRLHTNSMPMPDKAKPLSTPLLNLDGPPELAVQPGNASELNNSRRKRKRRKKKTFISGTGRA